MSSSPPEFIAQTLVNFSTIGFIIFFGTAAFIPTVLELTVLRKHETELLLMYPYRLISRLGETWSIFIIMCISLLFVVTGGFSLYYLFNNEGIFISIAKFFILSTLSLVFLYMIGIIIYAIPIKKREIKQIIEYSNVGYRKDESEKPQEILENIHSVNGKKSNNNSKSNLSKKKK